MGDFINEKCSRFVFTDLYGAIEEADFLDEKHGRKYVLIQLMLGGIHVVRSDENKGGQFIYTTRRDETHISNAWEKPRSMTLARYHQDAAI